MADILRIDQFLWFVRVYKTRSISTEHVKKGRIKVNGQSVKPSSYVHAGDTIQVRKPPITVTYKVIELPKSRIGAKILHQYLVDLTPPSEYKLLEIQKFTNINRDKGDGRPTKKERRDLDEFIMSDEYFETDLDDEELNLGFEDEDYSDFWNNK